MRKAYIKSIEDVAFNFCYDHVVTCSFLGEDGAKTAQLGLKPNVIIMSVFAVNNLVKERTKWGVLVYNLKVNY